MGVTTRRVVHAFAQKLPRDALGSLSVFPDQGAGVQQRHGASIDALARELEVTSSLAVPRCIRVLMHYYGDKPPEPVYLGQTARLVEPPDPV